jgi:hypothetical protein
VEEYLHVTSNMLVDSRISLYVLYPGLSVNGPVMGLSVQDSDVDLGDGDPFNDEVNFGLVANETGGKLFFDRNDVDAEMRESERLGSEYYTLTYQPHNNDDDGRFERIRVKLRNPNLRAVTKAGYFAPDKNAPVNARQQGIQNLITALQSKVPFDAIHIAVVKIVRQPDTETARFTLHLARKHLQWTPTGNGSSQAKVFMAGASLDSARDIVASKVREYTVIANTQNPTDLRDGPDVSMALTMRLPKKAKAVRLVVEPDRDERMGSAEVEQKEIRESPSAPTPEPRLSYKRPETPAAN